ncbi:hypothetical protein GCM10023149_05280 [Mucilaginibacter gynuensis]|uniref:TPM domain-containing protein n=1 Tax=Mucilaginibacter gynuensis TaxID=1302236 RepID=A0ABP8FT92_9SPHI
MNDFVGVLTSSEVENLNKSINTIENQTGVQFAIVLIDKLPPEYEIEDYALLIGRKWHIGKNKNGLVYVAAISQRKQRLEVARNLEDVLTEDKCLEIMNAIKPHFKKADYNAGLAAMIEQVQSQLNVTPQRAASVTSADVKADTKGEQAASESKTEPLSGFETFLAFLIFLGIPVFAVIYLIYRINKSNRDKEEHRRQYLSNFSPGESSGRYYGGSYGGSRSSSGVGTFLGGAAAGYMAKSLMDKHNEEEEEKKRRDREEQEEDRRRRDEESDNQNRYGNWGSGGSSDSSSSSNSGFSGSGATSDW